MMDPSDCLLPMWLNKDDCLLVLLSCRDDTCWATRQETSERLGRGEASNANEASQARQGNAGKKRENRIKMHPHKCRWWHCSRLPWVLSLYCSAVRMQYSGRNGSASNAIQQSRRVRWEGGTADDINRIM